MSESKFSIKVHFKIQNEGKGRINEPTRLLLTTNECCSEAQLSLKYMLEDERHMPRQFLKVCNFGLT